MTLSAALAVMAVGVTAPQAHAHGNNPKVQGPAGDTWPHSPPDSPPRNHDIDEPRIQTAGPGVSGFGGFESTSLGVFLDPAGAAGAAAKGGLLEPAPSALAELDLNASASGVDILDMDVSSGGGGAFVGIPPRSVVPSPGTLALLGLGALVLRRRRR